MKKVVIFLFFLQVSVFSSSISEVYKGLITHKIDNPVREDFVKELISDHLSILLINKIVEERVQYGIMEFDKGAPFDAIRASFKLGNYNVEYSTAAYPFALSFEKKEVGTFSNEMILKEISNISQKYLYKKVAPTAVNLEDSDDEFIEIEQDDNFLFTYQYIGLIEKFKVFKLTNGHDCSWSKNMRVLVQKNKISFISIRQWGPQSIFRNDSVEYNRTFLKRYFIEVDTLKEKDKASNKK